MKILKYSTLLFLTVLLVGYSLKNSKLQFLESSKESNVVVASYYNMNGVRTPHPSNKIRSGNTVTIYLEDNIELQGTINCAHEYTDGVIRFGGTFDEGTFIFAATKDDIITGIVFYKGDAYELTETSTKSASFIKKDINSVICTQHPSEITLAAGTINTGTINTGTVTTVTNVVVPILSSKPSSINQIYLEFRGLTVQDPMWNGGKTIVATPPNYTTAQIIDVYNVVVARYAAFDVNVTTDLERYTKAKPNTRTRVIFTTNDSWLPNCGGVAFISSFKLAGSGWYSSNVPCWAFTRTFGNATKNVGEVAAHETGHTLGLFHDGTATSPYYYGQGNWAPIMGCAYGKTVVQFSKGEYTGANVKQDDIATVRANLSMGSLVVAPSVSFILTSGTFNKIENIIAGSLDIKTYTIPIVSLGTLTVTASPTLYSAVDLTLQLLKNGSMIATVDPVNTQAATLNVPVTSGTYTLRVVPSGNNDPKNTVYSSYGSIGAFTLAGSLTFTNTNK